MDPKQKLSSLKSWIASKAAIVARSFAQHYIIWLVVLSIPPVLISGALFYQSREVDKVLQKPLFTKRQVKQLEKQVASSQAQVIHYKQASDSLGRKVASLEVHTKDLQKQADSLHTVYETTSPSWHSTAELQSYLLHYQPGPDPN